MTDAITQISYQTNAIQNLCLASAPTYDSPFCSLAIRPITNPDRSQLQESGVNFPTEIHNSPLNAAQQKTQGYDIRDRLQLDMAGGHFSVRHLVGYQPVNTTINIPGAFPTWAVEPKLRQTTFLSYTNNSWTVALQNQWLSSVNLATSDNALNGNSQNYVQPRLPTYDVVDTTIRKRFGVKGANLEVFLTVNNVLNDTLRCSLRTRGSPACSIRRWASTMTWAAFSPSGSMPSSDTQRCCLRNSASNSFSCSATAAWYPSGSIHTDSLEFAAFESFSSMLKYSPCAPRKMSQGSIFSSANVLR